MRGSGLSFALYILLGLYFLNFGLAFIPKLIEVTAGFSKWIIFIGGILLIVSGIKFLVSRRYMYR